MFKNLHLKLFALALAIVFWIFVVSLENSFTAFPQEVPVQAFNLGQEFALKRALPAVKLMLRSEGGEVFRSLTAGDFEAYTDLSTLGVGKHTVSVSVTSKQPKVSVARVIPESIEVEIESLKQKAVTLKPEIIGEPAKGYTVDKIELSSAQVKVRGAESIIQNITEAKAIIRLDGTEKETVTKKVEFALGSGVSFENIEVTATVTFSENAQEKIVGVKPAFTGSVPAGTLKNISVTPSVITIQGKKEALEKITAIETEPIDLSQFDSTKTITSKLRLPENVALAKGEPVNVQVTVEIEK